MLATRRLPIRWPAAWNVAMALTPYQQLEQEFRRLHAFRGAASILRWDSAVMMPRGSSDLRGEQLAALETESHALLTSPRVSRLLERAEADLRRPGGLAAGQPARDAPRARPRHRHAADAVSRLAKATSPRRGQVDRGARRRATSRIFAPHLEEVVRAGARQGRAAGQGAQARAVRRAARRVQPRHDDSRDRRASSPAVGRRLPD